MRLSPKAEKLHAKLLDKFPFNDAEKEVLYQAMCALTLAEMADDDIQSNGSLTIEQANQKGGFNTVIHPSVAPGRASRAQFLQACKQLGISDPYGGTSGGKQGRGAQGARTK